MEHLGEQTPVIDIHREKLKLLHETKQKALDTIAGYVPEHVVDEVREAFNSIIEMK